MTDLVGTEETWRGFQARYPAQRISVAKELWDRISAYVEANVLDWRPAAPKGRWWLGYKRAERYFVVTIAIWVERPVEFAVKIPDSPDALGLSTHFPGWTGPGMKYIGNGHGRSRTAQRFPTLRSRSMSRGGTNPSPVR